MRLILTAINLRVYFTLLLSLFIWNLASAQKSEEAITEKQRDGEYVFIQGESQYLLENYDSALKLFNDALKSSGEQAGIHYKIAQCYLHLGKTQNAIEHAEKAIELEPETREYYLAAIDIRFNQKQYNEAVDLFEKMFTNCDHSVEYREDAASIYQEMAKSEFIQANYYNDQDNKKDKKKAKEHKELAELYIKKSIEQYDSLETYTGISAELSSVKQQLYLKINDLDGALHEIDKLINEFPEDNEYKFYKVEVLATNGLEKKALEYLEGLEEKYPKEAKIHLYQSDIERQLGNTEKANELLYKAFDMPSLTLDDRVLLISNFIETATEEELPVAQKLAEETVRNNPDKAQAYSILGDIQYLQKRPIDARNSYVKVIELDSSKFLVWQQIITIDLENGDNELLVEHSARALEIFPEKGVLWFYNGLGHQMIKNNQEASTAYEKAIPLSENNYNLLEQIHAQLGDVYSNIEQKDKAYKNYEEALIINPNNVHVLNNYSYFLSLDKKELGKAKSMIKKVIRMQPDEPTYLDTYGWVLYQLKEYKEAVEILETAARETQDPTILEHYGDALYKYGKTDQALDAWKKAKENGASSEELDKKIRDEKLND